MTLNKRRIIVIAIWSLIMTLLILAFFIFDGKKSKKPIVLSKTYEKIICYDGQYYFDEQCKDQKRKVLCSNEKCEISSNKANEIIIIDNKKVIIYDYVKMISEIYDIGLNAKKVNLISKDDKKYGLVINNDEFYGFYNIDLKKLTINYNYSSFMYENDYLNYLESNHILATLNNDKNNKYLLDINTGEIILVGKDISLIANKYYQLTSDSQKYRLYDKNGKNLLDNNEYYFLRYVSDNIIYISYDKSTYEIIDINNISTFKSELTEIINYTKDVIISKKNNKLQLINYNNILLTEFEMDENEEFAASMLNNNEINIEFTKDNNKKIYWYNLTTKESGIK